MAIPSSLISGKVLILVEPADSTEKPTFISDYDLVTEHADGQIINSQLTEFGQLSKPSKSAQALGGYGSFMAISLAVF